MSIFSKPLTEVNLGDLNDLKGVLEWDRLDFKSQTYGHADEEKREMLRDVTSFANARGGYLILGIEEDEEGRATSIVGIENAEEEESWMMSSCLANIEERIIGLRFQTVRVGEGTDVLICHIPRSTRAPHMITFRGLNQFWKRHGRQKQKMSVEEVREACVRTENVRKSLEDFLGERRKRFLEEFNEPHLWLTITPLTIRDEVLDIHDATIRELMKRPPYQRRGGWIVGDIAAYMSLPPRPSLYGLVVESRNRYQLELFRNAHMEFFAPIVSQAFIIETLKGEEGANHRIMNPFALSEFPFSCLYLARAVYDYVGLMEPIVVGFGITNAGGLGLKRDHPKSGSFREESFSVWRDSWHVEIPLAQFPYPLQPDKVAKYLVDRLWNAFGYEQCPMFDDQGRFVVDLGKER